ncbi:MAG: copper amine oxidase N-terminal domain-containing protein [Firmicutes bacterium]|nr:copper amine oxidase N-terminal domain-containing protein [Bacillota bacterium]
MIAKKGIIQFLVGKEYYVRVVLFVIVLAFILANISLINHARAESGKGKGYILIGDVEPPWYSTAIRSIFGTVDIRKDLDPVVKEQEKKMRDMGYDVEIIEIAVTSDVEKILNDDSTKALAWFGHGDPGVPGTIAAYDGDITPGDIKSWAQDKLAEKIGRPEDWKSLPPDERKKRYELWNNAHMNLKYAYFHTCYSLANNELPDVLMDDGGKFYGYKEKAYLSNDSTMAEKIRGKDAQSSTNNGHGEADTSTSGTGSSGGQASGVFPAEPFNGMQITYSVSGASITASSDSPGFTTARTLSGNLGSGQLLVSGSAKMGNGYGADLRVTVSVDGDGKDFSAYIKSGYPGFNVQPFSVAVPIPAGAKAGSFSISMTGHYNAGERGLVVSGSFEAPVQVTQEVDTWDYPEGYVPPEPPGDSGGYAPGGGPAAGGAQGNGRVSVLLNGKKIPFDVPPLVENGRTLVPIRKIAEALGAQVDWDPGGYVRINKDDQYILLQVDRNVALVNYEHKYLDVPPKVINGRTLVPLRFVAEAFGLNVGWDGGTQTVRIDRY